LSPPLPARAFETWMRDTDLTTLRSATQVPRKLELAR